MSSPEPESVTTLELYRQGARLETKLDKLDDKLDGHGERIVQLEHHAVEQDRRHRELKAELDKQADSRWRSLSVWIAGLSLLVATIALIIMMAKTGVRP